jgi:hypothetical protein
MYYSGPHCQVHYRMLSFTLQEKLKRTVYPLKHAALIAKLVMLPALPLHLHFLVALHSVYVSSSTFLSMLVLYYAMPEVFILLRYV